MKRKIFSILFALVLALGFILATAVPAGANGGTTWYVDDSATGANNGTSWTDAFTTIGAAVTAASGGDTINVAAGTYTATSLESIVITKDNLSLVGESRDGTIIDAGTWGTSGAGWPMGIHVYASNVTIQNFTVQGFTGDMTSTGGYGILFRDYAHDMPAEGYIYYSGGVVDNVKLQNNYSAMYALVHRNLTVKNSLIQNNFSDGMFIARESDNATITGNTVINSGDQGIWVGYCWMGLGPSDNAIITNNTVDGAREGGISFVKSNGATISGNTITNVAGECNPAGWSVGALSLKDGCSNVEAFNNTIYNNDGLWGGHNGTGNGIGIDGTPSNINLHNNNIYGNTGYGCRNYSTVPVLAACNWWGDGSGPEQATTNPGGTGDAVSDYVVYSPWLSQQWSHQVWVDATYTDTTLGWGADHFALIQEAINTVPSGTTINVAAGTYNENLTITKALTLQGEGKDLVTLNPTTAAYAIGVSGGGSNVTIENLAISAGSAKFFLVHVSHVGNFCIQNVRVVGAGKDVLSGGEPLGGIDLNTVTTAAILNVEVQDVSRNGLALMDSTNVMIESANIHDTGVSTGWAGVAVYATVGTTSAAFAGTSTITNTPMGIYVEDYPGTTVNLSLSSGITLSGQTMAPIVRLGYGTVPGLEATGTAASFAEELGLIARLAAPGSTPPYNLGASFFYTVNDALAAAVDPDHYQPNTTVPTDVIPYMVVYDLNLDEFFVGPGMSIQAAIDAALAGDTINVAAGTYDLTSPIKVTKALTLTGDIATPSNVVINAPVVGDAPYPSDKDCFQVRADNVTIEGFRIQGAHIDMGHTSDGWQNAGIMVGSDPGANMGGAGPLIGIQNTVIRYNEITNNSYGIHAYRAQHTTISHNKIYGNTQDGNWSGKGIMFYSQVYTGDPNPSIQTFDVDILNNQFYDNELMGIEFNSTEVTGELNLDVLMDGNVFYNNGGPWDGLGYAIDVYRGISSNGTADGSETGVTITNNEFYNHWATSGPRFSSGSAAIRPYNAKDWTISNNHLHDNLAGIRFAGPLTMGNSVTGNEFHHNAQGIRFEAGTMEATHFNNIYDNNVSTYISDGYNPYGVLNLSAVTFDATNNWWGYDSGPKDSVGTTEVPPGEGVSVADMVNADGEGDEVSENVDYYPWLGVKVTGGTTAELTAGETLDATGEADTTVTVTGGSATVTVAEYSSNPGGGFSGGNIGKYVDVNITDAVGVTRVEIRLYYTQGELNASGVDEASLRLRWWDGSSWKDWVPATYSGVNPTPVNGYKGYIWGIIDDTVPTSPSVADLAGTPFGGGAPPAGGGAPPATLSKVGSVSLLSYLDSQGRTRVKIILRSDDGVFTITIFSGTLAHNAEGNLLASMGIITLSTPPPPPGYVLVGHAYDCLPDGANFAPNVAMAFNYNEANIPDGVNEQDLVLAYWDGDEWVNLPTTIDAAANTATTESGHFTPFALLAYTGLASFTTSDLSITPAAVDIGQEVTIALSVANAGDSEGSYSVVLKINGIKETEKSITLAAGSSQSVSFSVTREEAGSYSVDVNGLTGSFTVAPAAPPEEAPPATSAPIAWWIWVIAGVVVVGLVVFFVVRRRAS